MKRLPTATPNKSFLSSLENPPTSGSAFWFIETRSAVLEMKSTAQAVVGFLGLVCSQELFHLKPKSNMWCASAGFFSGVAAKRNEY